MANSSDNATVEEIIKRRLLIDGDGMGDERKLNSLIKSYVCLLDSEDSEENDLASLRRIQGQVRQMEVVVRRTHESIQRSLHGTQVNKNLKDSFQAEIVETKAKIVSSKASLEEATKNRKHSMEYDALAKLIESKPDRKATEVKRMGLELELDTLQRRDSKLGQELDYRKQTATMMGSSIERLKDLMDYHEQIKLISINKNLKPTSNRDGGIGMDVDSTSQSEPPSPMDQTPCSLEAVNGTTSVEKVLQIQSAGQAVTSGGVSTEKAKSEKYEDLSESEDDDGFWEQFNFSSS
ncbi:unnamed protein product [Orchesella dallaii]|uniref:THO complex subunit 7 n=1 Tax=Orchesella dallaii TaxID=48710 RepID=A0ABP1QPS2_9HEXA